MAEATPAPHNIPTLLSIERSWHTNTPINLQLLLRSNEKGKLYLITSTRIVEQLVDIIDTPYAYYNEQDKLVCIVGIGKDGRAGRTYNLINLHESTSIEDIIQEEYTAAYISTLQARYDSYKKHKSIEADLSYANRMDKLVSDQKIAVIKEELDKWVASQITAYFNRYFAVVLLPSPFVVVKQIVYETAERCSLYLHRLDTKAFAGSAYGGTVMPGEGPKRREVATFWLKDKENRREYNSLVFCETTPPKCLNMWHGSPLDKYLEEANPEDARMWVQHIYNHIKGGMTVADYTLNLFAWIIQHPLERPNIAILERGDQGGGKNYILSPFKAIYGKHYQYQRSSQACGRFTMSLANCRALVIDEAGDWEQHEIDLLKMYITNDVLTHEEKGLPLVTLPNCMAVFIMSNAEHCKLIERSDRRIFAIDIDDERCANTEENRVYWNEAWKVPPVAVYKWLLMRDTTGFNPRNYPITDSAREQKEYGFNSTITWWVAELREENSDIFGKLLTKETLYKMYVEWTQSNNRHAKIANDVWFWRQLYSLLPKELTIVRTGTKVRQQTIAMPDLHIVRQIFAKYVKDDAFFN